MTWNQTLHGTRGSARWDFLNPDPAAIDWHVVALVLSRLPRFGGHTTQGIYSVAQHLVEGARAILRDTGNKAHAAAFLLHDVHETWIGDDARPKIEALATLAYRAASKDSDHAHDCRNASKWLKAAYKELQARADAVIYPAAGLPWPLSPEAAAVVKEYDNRMLRTEADARTGPRAASWGDVVENAVPIVGADMSVWGEALACSLFLAAARELLPVLSSPSSVPAPVECECCEAPLVPASGGWHDPVQLPLVGEDWQGLLTVPLGRIRLAPASEAKRSKPEEACDWAAGRRPGTCRECGGVFGMWVCPTTCTRSLVSV